MAVFSTELIPAGVASGSTGGFTMEWPRDGQARSNVVSTLNWDLEPFAAGSVQARDLFRITVAAYLADTAVAKPAVSLHRALDVAVHVEEPELWRGGPLSALAEILHWLTGDDWTLSLRGAEAALPLAVAEPADRVQLLSGGLDSLCGAAVALRETGTRLRFVGHRDGAKAVRHAQSAVEAVLDGQPYDRYELYLRDTAQRHNHGPRSRSLMFMALGVMAASTRSAGELWVPENGFTSLNPPLDAGRGGPLTTRSTHPYTFMLIQQLLVELRISVAVRNPFAGMTKGELVAAASPDVLGGLYPDAVAASFSCAKGGSQFHGGNSYHNCGLCVACVVRRAAFCASGTADPTPYDSQILTGDRLAGLVQQRWRDIVSLRYACENGIPEELVLASAQWPLDTDFDEVFELVQRGLEEVRLVPLPTP